ncbi:4-coumarate--CoA ligase [Hondaea fermentalgiana]|uniref:4-coumarate--CoA ligase n=1 Tax=Hondaea fermentalgiana TaxID=2315210 RepID=A0A2R5GFB8_9STRA|nr:4-coumarate--CoA ligase [Hondaea fermentalgiana]|eukprot:GBG28438.1 4-coumarate--CoA ligase [Hondaea fermentalgiana]
MLAPPIRGVRALGQHGARRLGGAGAGAGVGASRGYQSVTKDENHVYTSTFPEQDGTLVDKYRFTEFMMRDFHKQGSALAILDGVTGDERSFEDLLDDVQKVGRGIQEEFQIGKGSSVALFMPNHVDFFTALHAPAKLGAVVTPINPAYREYEVANQLRSADVRLVIAHPDTLHVAREAASQKNREKGPDEAICQVICVSDEFADFRAGPKVTDLLPDTPADPESTLYLPFSSGTTGKPKGVELTHSNLIWNVLQSHEVDNKFFHDKTVVLSPLPMFHIYGFLVSVHSPLYHGKPLITMKRFDLERFCALVEEHKCTRAHVVPPILLQLSKSPIVDKYDMSSLEICQSAAAPLGTEVENAVRDRLKCEVKQLWGMSELSPLGTGNPDDRVKGGSAGPPIAHTQVKIVDVSTGETLGPGEEGELCVRGPQVMKGYLNDPEKTRETLTEDGWLRTGDIAKVDEHGYVYITDRLKELIKVKGFPVAPAELEAVVFTHPDVIDTCVIPVPDEESGEIPRAYCVMREGHKTTEQDIVDYVADIVAPYKKLRGGVVFVDFVPKTESGKLLRRVLIQQDRERTAEKQ